MDNKLSNKSFWEDFYNDRKNVKFFPNAKKYRSHFELDLIFRKFLSPSPNKKLLELGAGDSIWLPYFAKNYKYDVYGIDYSEIGCEKAERNLNLAGVRGTIICKDFFQLDRSWYDFFDIIVSFGVIEHFKNPPEILNFIRKFLKKDGLIITIVPNTSGNIMKIQKLIDEKVYKIHEIFDLEQLCKFHEKAGFSVRLKKYFQFMDLSVLNYQNVIKGKTFKIIAKSITAINLPILYFEKLFKIFPQSKKYCSSMIVIGEKRKLL